MSNQWQQRSRPARLERRYQFENYEHLRDFLDRAAEISEREGYYPDMGFGRDYVNIIIHTEDEAEELNSMQYQFAQKLDDLVNEKAH